MVCCPVEIPEEWDHALKARQIVFQRLVACVQERPISRATSRSYLEPDHPSRLCASCVPDFGLRHSQGDIQPHVDHECQRNRYYSSSSTQSSIRLLTHVHLMFGPATSTILFAGAFLGIYDADFRRATGCLAFAFLIHPLICWNLCSFLAPGLRLSLQFLFVGMALR